MLQTKNLHALNCMVCTTWLQDCAASYMVTLTCLEYYHRK